MGEKKVDNLVTGVEQAKLAGLAIRHVGAGGAKRLAQFRRHRALMQADEDTLAGIPESAPSPPRRSAFF